MIDCDIDIIGIATLITALASLLTGFYLWYDRRARIIISVEVVDFAYYLTLENVGKSVARDIKISINKDFIDSLPELDEQSGGRIKQILYNIQQRKFYFAPGVKKRYYLIQCPKKNSSILFDRMCYEWHEKHKYTSLRVNVVYNGWFDCTEDFFLEQFNSEALLYKTPLEKLAEPLKEIGKKQKEIASSLNKLNYSLNKISNNIDEQNENAEQ